MNVTWRYNTTAVHFPKTSKVMPLNIFFLNRICVIISWGYVIVVLQKFVCTSIRPSQLPYQELYDWDGAAEFVSDYLEFVPLDPPFELVKTKSERIFTFSVLKFPASRNRLSFCFVLLCSFLQPTRMFSSSTVLKKQKGHCFEYSTLLCSLLIGAGYDAYVVSGYATREICLRDETREICPLLKKTEEVRLLLKNSLNIYAVSLWHSWTVEPNFVLRLQLVQTCDIDMFQENTEPVPEISVRTEKVKVIEILRPNCTKNMHERHR